MLKQKLDVSEGWRRQPGIAERVRGRGRVPSCCFLRIVSRSCMFLAPLTFTRPGAEWNYGPDLGSTKTNAPEGLSDDGSFAQRREKTRNRDIK